MELRFPISRPYVNLLDNRSRWLVLYGGAGSGKSYFAAQKIVNRMICEPDHFFVVTRKVARTCRDSVYKLLKDVIRSCGCPIDQWVFHDSEMRITYKGNGSRLICMGLDDPEKVKSIAGVTSMWHEEATELDQQDIAQLDLRLRGHTSYYKQHIVSFNPISALHWLKSFFFDNPPEDVTVHHSTYKDNAFIDAQYKAILESYIDRDANYHRVYALGEWGVLQGVIYDPWEIMDERDYPEFFDETIYGMDFGFNNPTALIRIGLRDKVAYLTECLYRSDMTTSDLVGAMKALNISGSTPIYADASEPDRIEEIHRAGFNVIPADKGPGSVSAGIDTVRRTRIITSPRNENVNKEAGSYKWREDRTGNILDEPAKINDHAMDAIRYALHSHAATKAGGFFVL